MPGFTLCLNTSTIRPTPLAEKIRVAAAAGFQAIEPWNVEVDEYLAQGGTLAELRARLDDAGLAVPSMIALGGWITSEGRAWQAALDEARRRMEQAAALGCPTIVASPPDEVINLAHAGDRFARLNELGQSLGVRPSMEFLGFVAGIKSLAAAVAITALAGIARPLVVADVFHMMRGGSTIDDLRMVTGAELSIFHINDLPPSPPPTAQTDADRVMLGDGIADLPRVLANLHAIGYAGPLSLELFHPGLWAQDPLAVASLGRQRLQALIEA